VFVLVEGKGLVTSCREMGRFEGRVERLRAAAKERGEFEFDHSSNLTSHQSSNSTAGARGEASEGSRNPNPELGEPLFGPCS